jgi:putative toxin-antitoxin system antitoxin component (TIGR02293 family)
LNDIEISAVEVLGGEAVLHALPRTTSEWIALVRLGVPFMSFESAAHFLGIDKRELASSIGIDRRTLARQKDSYFLCKGDSEKLIRLVKVVVRTVEVFEDKSSAIAWLQASNTSLGNASPLSLLDTELGAELVTNTLGRIEQGVFADIQN